MHANLDLSPEGRLVVGLIGVLRHLKRIDTGPLEPAALAVLHQSACAALPRVSDVAGTLGLDASTVSRHVRHLIEAGYLERQPDPDDRRAVRLALSAPGRSVLADAHAARTAAVRRALEHWPRADRDRLLELVERLATELGAAVDPAPHPQTSPTTHRVLETR